MSTPFLEQVEARRGRWREDTAQAQGITPLYYWTGQGTYGLEVAYGTSESKPKMTTVREVWTRRHKQRAVPLLVVISYPDGPVRRAVVCGPTGEDPRVLDVEHGQAERLADAALGEPDRHQAIRFLADANTEEVLFGFAPVSSQAPQGRTDDKYDLLVATDVLAEGVNLQQARHIVNFDLPWNPMRLVQRHGRIDRIGSPHSHVYLRCFFPSKDLDTLLGLEAALQRKITQAARSIGVEGEIVPGSHASDFVFAHTQDQIKALQKQDASIFDESEDLGTLSGEEFRRELTNAIKDPHWKNSVRNLPWVAGSGKVTEGSGGFVFCAKVGDHQRPQYRWVPLAEDGQSIEAGAMVEDTLTCLGKAVCTPDTERVLPANISDLAYDAWEAARQHIYDRWIESTDPANMQPAIPKPMREAADLLRNHSPKDLGTERLGRILDAIEAPYDTRTQRMMRRTLDEHDGTRERVAAVIALVDDLGLQPPPPVEPLPEIDPQDVNLVTWLALVPG